MINTLDDYISRSIPEGCDFATNPNLAKKVERSGRMLPYKGNTVVFLLDDEIRRKLNTFQISLYDAAPEMLAESLESDTFHMTLHDLANGMSDQTGLDPAKSRGERFIEKTT